MKKGTDRGMRRWRAVALLAAGVAVGVTIMATPAGAHFGSVAHFLSTHADPRYANVVGGTDRARNADKVDGLDSPALRDGPSIVMGRTTNPTSQDTCLVGAPSGLAPTALCTTGPTGTGGVEMPLPSARVVRNVFVRLTTPNAGASTFYFVWGAAFNSATCVIPASQTTCTIAGPLNIPQGDAIHIEYAGSGVDSPLSFSYELWSQTASASVTPRSATSLERGSLPSEAG
jgi:hypothetical protein